MPDPDPNPIATMRGQGKLPPGGKPGDTPLGAVYDKAKKTKVGKKVGKFAKALGF